MRRLGAGAAGRKGGSAGRSIAFLLIAWVALIALVIYQMPAFTGSAQAMPLSPSAVVEDVAVPCAAMDQAAGQDMAGTSATPDSGMPCCATTTPDDQKSSTHTCPLMGGCFSMCVSITPMAAEVQEIDRIRESTLSFDEMGTPHAIPPLQRPPKHL
jgi:hypothetical protein